MRNRFWRAWGRQLGLVCLCCLLIVSCGRSTPEASSDPGRIVLGTTSTLSTIDPADAYGTFAGSLLYNLGDRLYNYQLGSNNLEPQLATALPQVSADGLTYRIPLRQGVKFHDGTLFNAKAMAFSLERFIQNGGAPAFLLADAVDKVAATADYELTIKLKQPFAAFPALLAFSGACAVSPQAYTIKAGEFQPEKFVGTGPYQLVKYGTDQLKLVAFDQYWGERPANPGIDIQFFSSPANLFNAFRKGSVDVAYQSLALEQIRYLQEQADGQKGWQVIERSGSGVNYLSLNLQSPPLDQLPVRQAIAAVIDRTVLEQRVFQGQVAALYSLIPSTLSVQRPVFQTAYGDANASKARQLLTEAGYSASKPLHVELWYRSNLENDRRAAVTLKAVAQKQLGGLLQFDLNSVESTTAYKNLDKGAYPIFLLDWSPDFFDADNYIQPFMECTKGDAKTGCTEGASFGQGSFYFNDRVNQLITRSRQPQTAAARQQVFGELQTILATEVPFIPLWQSKDFLVAQKNIQGASLEVTQKVPFWKLRKHSG
jgi:peptide/nickel transport system substrate-binding protein